MDSDLNRMCMTSGRPDAMCLVGHGCELDTFHTRTAIQTDRY